MVDVSEDIRSRWLQLQALGEVDVFSFSFDLEDTKEKCTTVDESRNNRFLSCLVLLCGRRKRNRVNITFKILSYKKFIK